MPPVVDENLCDGCSLCVRSCPGDIIYYLKNNKKALIAYPAECWHCGCCEIECRKHLKTTSAIQMTFPNEWLI